MSSISNLKILCVEDDDFALEEMALFLKKRAGKVFTASDGVEGIEQYEIHRPDIVIVDILMPRMDGTEMIRHLKEMDPDVHILIVSSVSVLDVVLQAVDMGVDNYIVKPLEFDELETKLDKIGDAIAAERNTAKGGFDVVDEKHYKEDLIKKEVIKALKKYMGKGPREITVHLIGDSVNITILSSLTVMEEHLIEDIRNHEMVKQLRRTAYEAISKKLQMFISEVLERNVTYDKVSVDLKKKVDTLRFVAGK